jgi:serine/threonine-protein kinase RsbW
MAMTEPQAGLQPPVGSPGTGMPMGRADGTVSVDLRVPADAAQLPLLRSVAGALAGAQDYDIDTIADLRMAVDELVATVVRRARGGAAMRCTLTALPSGITVEASAPAADPAPVDETGFGWMVLTTLATEVRASVSDVDGAGPVVSMRLRISPGRVAR